MKEILFESIDGSQALPFSKIHQNLYEFELENTPQGDLHYEVLFDQYDVDVVEIVFLVGEKGPAAYNQIDLGFKNAIKVFNTVYVIIEDFLESSLDKINILEFSAKDEEKSRVKFYKTLAKQLAIKKGYKPEDVVIDHIRDPNVTSFLIPVG